MDLLWQQVIVFAAVCLALIYLVVYYVRRKRRRAGCTNCPTLKVLQGRRKAEAK